MKVGIRINGHAKKRLKIPNSINIYYLQKKYKMKTKILTLATAGMLVVSGIFYGFTTKNATCPKEGTSDCPKKTCPLVGTPECPLGSTTAVMDCCKKK